MTKIARIICGYYSRCISGYSMSCNRKRISSCTIISI
nr:MAG TPA: hypothetical protein [Caudoviricetes sp.]